MEVYRKPAIGRVHLELSPGSTCFRLSPEIGFDQLHDDDTRGGEPRVRARPAVKRAQPFSRRRTTAMKSDVEQVRVRAMVSEASPPTNTSRRLYAYETGESTTRVVAGRGSGNGAGQGTRTILPPSPPASMRVWTSRAAARGRRSMTTGWMAPSRSRPNSVAMSALNSSGCFVRRAVMLYHTARRPPNRNLNAPQRWSLAKPSPAESRPSRPSAMVCDP